MQDLYKVKGHLIYTIVSIMGGYQGMLAGDVANP
jgi:hypothetical protein